jgi:hypothetical protein
MMSAEVERMNEKLVMVRRIRNSSTCQIFVTSLVNAADTGQ